jgi:hypothetical protein
MALFPLNVTMSLHGPIFQHVEIKEKGIWHKTRAYFFFLTVRPEKKEKSHDIYQNIRNKTLLVPGIRAM